MSTNHAIGTVLLDLDGVIRHFDPDHVRHVERRHGLPPDSLTDAAFEPSLLHLVTTGRIPRSEWTNRIGQATGSTDAASEWLAATGTIDAAVMADIARMRHAGLTVAVLTNGTDTTIAELDELGITESFDAVFNSAVIGFAKPDRRAFEHVCHELHLSPSEVLFVDDSLPNVIAATELGMTAIHHVDAASWLTTIGGLLQTPSRQRPPTQQTRPTSSNSRAAAGRKATPSTPLHLPTALRTAIDVGEPALVSWSNELPDHVEFLTNRWGLSLEVPFEPGGSCAWVAPGIDRHGRSVVLKVAWQHSEALHEAQGLAILAGRGAADLYDFEQLPPSEQVSKIGTGPGGTAAMLLERCRPGEELRHRPESAQHPVIAGLLQSVWAVDLPSDHPFRPLSTMADDWVAGAEARLGSHPTLLDAGMARDGLALFTELSRSRSDDVLLVTDLHAGNVLSGTRHPWLLIDPKPYVGDRHFDALQHILNCTVALRTDPGGLVNEVADLAGLDASRLRAWLFARCVQEMLGNGQPWSGLGQVVPQLVPR
jgi:streptomycin 6-kinase